VEQAASSGTQVGQGAGRWLRGRVVSYVGHAGRRVSHRPHPLRAEPLSGLDPPQSRGWAREILSGYLRKCLGRALRGLYEAFQAARILRTFLHLLDPGGLAALSDPPVVPSGPLGVSPDPPLCPPVLVVSLYPPALLVSLLKAPYSPACPPVPLVSLGSHSSIVWHSNSLVRPAAAATFPGVLLPAVRWLSSLAVAHACTHT
jgi:hypothetical protein